MKMPLPSPAILALLSFCSLAAISARAQTWTLTSPLYPSTPYPISFNTGSLYHGSGSVTIYAEAPGGSTWASFGGGGGPPGYTPITASGTIGFSVAGTWTIKAVDGSSDTSPTLDQITRTVSGISTIFSFSNLSYTYDGSTKTASVTPTPSDATYTADLTKGPNAGSYTVSATANGNYTGSGSATLTINKANQSTVSISPASQTVNVGGNVNFTASGGGVGGYNWGGSASGTGSTKSVTFGSPGTFYVTVQSPGDSNYNPSNTATSTITVNAVNGITYNNTNWPGSAQPGQVVSFYYNVTNSGSKPWGANHYLVLKDSSHNGISSVSVNGCGVGWSGNVNFSLTASTTPGTYTFYVQAQESGVEWFGAENPLSLSVSGLPGDADNDGVPDAIEQQLGTNPNSPAQNDSSNQTQLKINKPQ